MGLGLAGSGLVGLGAAGFGMVRQGRGIDHNTYLRRKTWIKDFGDGILEA